MTRNELIRKLQVKEDRERTQRCNRIMRAIKGTMTGFWNEELAELEQIVERAYGRTRLGRR